MSTSFKIVGAVAALLLSSTAALAQTTVPTGPISGPPPAPSTGNSGLIVSAFDASRSLSIVQYLGLNYLDVSAENLTQSLDFGTIDLSVFGGDLSNVRYNVFAADGQGSGNATGMRTTASVGLDFATTTLRVNGSITAATGLYAGIAQDCAAVNPCVYDGVTGYYAGAEDKWGTRYNSQLPVDASGALGQALGFFELVPTSRTSTSPATVTAYQYAGGFGTWLLSQSGGLTYNVPVVPLPAAVWLLLSGMGALATVGRRRKPNDSAALAA